MYNLVSHSGAELSVYPFYLVAAVILTDSVIYFLSKFQSRCILITSLRLESGTLSKLCVYVWIFPTFPAVMYCDSQALTYITDNKKFWKGLVVNACQTACVTTCTLYWKRNVNLHCVRCGNVLHMRVSNIVVSSCTVHHHN